MWIKMPSWFRRTHSNSSQHTINITSGEMHPNSNEVETHIPSPTITPDLASSNARVYLKYDLENPPPHPGPAWTRFVCISDTHSHKYQIPPGDVLLHAGDLSSWGHLHQLKITMHWLKSLPHPVKIVIAGNHDLCLDDEWREGGPWEHHAGEAIPSKDVTVAQAMIRSESMSRAGINYLEYESAQIKIPTGRTWEVYGSPAAPRYALGAFQYVGGFGSSAGDEIYANIPSSTEILLTHTPPYGICDISKKGRNAGCPSLASRLESEDLSRCRLHVFGHIHEAHGASIDSKGEGRVSVNAAMHNGQAVIVDLLN